jgi:hypothetical protein
MQSPHDGIVNDGLLSIKFFYSCYDTLSNNFGFY